MKISGSLPTLCGLGTLLGFLSLGCQRTPDDATPQGTCRIQQVAAVEKAQSYTTATQTTYSYDNVGSLTKSVSTINGRPLTGTAGTKTGTTTVTYTYDADGFLSASNSLQQTTDIGLNNTAKTEVYTIASSYSYTSGRLSQKTDNYSGTYVAPNEKVTSAYTYDTDGKLTAIIVTRYNNSAYQETWTYRDNQLVDYVQKTGAAETRPYVIEDGMIVKMTFPGQTDELVVTKTFDDQKRVTRLTNTLNGQLDRYDLQTWTEVKPATASLPVFKGFPTINQDFPFSGKTGVLATVKHVYWNAVTKAEQGYSESTSVVQANAQGYVSNVVTTTNFSSANGSQPTTYTASYTYTNCQ